MYQTDLCVLLVNASSVRNSIDASDERQSYDHITRAAKAGYALIVAYPLACAFPKLSICLLYLRVFRHRPSRFVTYGVAIYTIMNAFSFFIAGVLMCNPPSAYWNAYVQGRDPTIANATCVNTQAMSIATNPPNIASDLVLLFLPLPTVWKVQTSVMSRVGLMLTFFAGSL